MVAFQCYRHAQRGPCPTGHGTPCVFLYRLPIHHRKILPFAFAGDGVVFAQRVIPKIVIGQDAAQVWMPGKRDPEHIEGLAFEPLGPGVQRHQRIDGEVWLVQEDTEDE